MRPAARLAVDLQDLWILEPRDGGMCFSAVFGERYVVRDVVSLHAALCLELTSMRSAVRPARSSWNTRELQGDIAIGVNGAGTEGLAIFGIRLRRIFTGWNPAYKTTGGSTLRGHVDPAFLRHRARLPDHWSYTRRHRSHHPQRCAQGLTIPYPECERLGRLLRAPQRLLNSRRSLCPPEIYPGSSRFTTYLSQSCVNSRHGSNGTCSTRARSRSYWASGFPVGTARPVASFVSAAHRLLARPIGSFLEWTVLRSSLTYFMY